MSAQLSRFFDRHIYGDTEPNELVTEVWISAGRYYRKEASVRHYLFVIARSVLREYLRKLKRRIPVVSIEEITLNEKRRTLGADVFSETTSDGGDLPADGPGHETLQILRSDYEAIHAAVEEIREPYREVVRLWLAGLDSLQIAAALGLKYNTARSRLCRGQRLLRDVLEPRLA